MLMSAVYKTEDVLTFALINPEVTFAIAPVTWLLAKMKQLVKVQWPMFNNG